MARVAVSPGKLYTLLNEEFKKRRMNGCGICRMPLPYLINRPDEVSANWRIGTPPPCELGCDALVAEVAADFWPSYDLRDPFTAAVDAAQALPPPSREDPA